MYDFVYGDFMALQKDPLSWRPQYGEDADEDMLAQA